MVVSWEPARSGPREPFNWSILLQVCQNPGSFIVGIDVVKTKNASFPRNPTIINLFRYVKLSESAGYGIDKMLRWEKLTKQAVDFETSILYSTITYHLPKSGMKSSTKSSTKNEKAIISAIRSNPAISITEMCPITGLSRSGVQKIIIRLRQQGVLRRVGPAKGGYWEIIE